MIPYLNAHSHFSLLRALPSPAELARTAAEMQIPALALTDHRYLAGAVAFYRACREVCVQPLLGMEVDLADDNQAAPSPTLVLLSTSLTGWSNLSRLSSVLHLQPDPAAACRFDLLAAHCGDLIALADDLGDRSGRRTSVRNHPACICSHRQISNRCNCAPASSRSALRLSFSAEFQ